MKSLNTIEKWKPVVGYEHLYHVSSFGNLKALCVSKLRGRFFHKQPERLLKLKTDKYGYKIASICKDRIIKWIGVHRLIAMAFIKNCDNKEFINHINGIKSDNRLENLEWCTSSENAIHSVKMGLTISKKGEESTSSKLKEWQVKRIFLSNESGSTLSKRFNISSSQVFRIKKGARWHHFTSKLNIK